MKVDVAIVGGGWAGLVAARTLVQHNSLMPPSQRLSFQVLEATDHVGGRTLNQDVVSGKGNVAGSDVVELGGEWLAPTHHAAIALMRDQLGFKLFHRPFNFNLGTTANSTLRIVAHTSTGTRYAASPLQVLHDLPSATQSQIGNITAAFKTIAQRVPCDGPLTADMSALDDVTYDMWIRQQGATEQEARNWLMEFADDAEDGRSMSLLGVAWTFNCSSALVGAPSEDWYRVQGGTQGPALAIAEGLKGRISLNSPVKSVKKLPGERLGVFVEGGEQRLDAKHVLIAGLAAPVWSAIDFTPPLPADTLQLLARLSLGSSLKYMVVYPTPWWRARGFLGKIMTTKYPKSTKSPVSKYISECLDNSPQSWARGVIMCFIEGPQNRAFFRELPTAAQRREHVQSFIGYSFGDEVAATNATGVIEHNWADFPYTRGAYSSYFAPGVLSDFWETHQALRAHNGSVGMRGLWVAGSDYSGRGMGYIDGAIMSGQQAAERIIAQFKEGR